MTDPRKDDGQKLADANGTENVENRYPDGVNIAAGDTGAVLLDKPDSPDTPGSGLPENKIKEGVNYYDLKEVGDDFLILDEIEWIWSADSARAACPIKTMLRYPYDKCPYRECRCHAGGSSMVI